MSSPFFGLDIAATGLRAAQQQLDTAAHNVANANTPGYSRQSVRLVESAPYTFPAFNRTGLPGQIGTGVTVASVTRVRDNFLDLQVQAQTALQGEWDTRQQQLSKVESIFPEPSDSGLGSTISKYWSAWQDVAADPTSTAARTALTEQAASLAMDLNRDSTQLGAIATGIDQQVSQQVATVNSVFTPAPDEIEYARRVVEAFAQAVKEGKGACSLDGKMIDVPIAEKAQKVIRKAEAIGALQKM